MACCDAGLAAAAAAAAPAVGEDDGDGELDDELEGELDGELLEEADELELELGAAAEPDEEEDELLPLPRLVPDLPSSARSGSVGLAGSVGLEPQPEPAEPPLLIMTMGAPEMAMPAGPISMKLPPALRVSSIPASMTTFIPALR